MFVWTTNPCKAQLVEMSQDFPILLCSGAQQLSLSPRVIMATDFFLVQCHPEYFLHIALEEEDVLLGRPWALTFCYLNS